MNTPISLPQIQGFAAGYAEGYSTSARIFQHHANVMQLRFASGVSGTVVVPFFSLLSSSSSSFLNVSIELNLLNPLETPTSTMVRFADGIHGKLVGLGEKDVR